MADRFPSTLRAEQATAEEIQKADFDLLAKINTCFSELRAISTDIQTEIDNLNVPTIVTDQTYGRYRSYPDGSTQGRVITANRLRSAGLALTTNVPGLICSITIPPGTWEISAFIAYFSNLGGITISGFFPMISKTTGRPALDRLGSPLDGEVWMARGQQITTAVSTDDVESIAKYIFSPTVPVTLNVLAEVSFAASTIVGYGWIQAVSVL